MEKVKVIKKDGFVLFGIIVDKTEAGIWLKTEQEISFINYDLIQEIRSDPKYRGRIFDR